MPVVSQKPLKLTRAGRWEWRSNCERDEGAWLLLSKGFCVVCLLELLVPRGHLFLQSSFTASSLLILCPFLACVLVRVFSCCIKHLDQDASWEGKGFFSLHLPHCCSSPKGVRTGTQAGQEAGADGGMLLTGLLPLVCLACFLIELRTTSPHPQWALPPLITN